jgi:hypothetical protein
MNTIPGTTRAEAGCGKVSVLLFRRERRALALRKIQQLQGALVPGLPFIDHDMPFLALSEGPVYPSSFAHLIASKGAQSSFQSTPNLLTPTIKLIQTQNSPAQAGLHHLTQHFNQPKYNPKVSPSKTLRNKPWEGEAP